MDLSLPYFQVEVIFPSSLVHPIKLSNCVPAVKYFAISKESPDLANHHTEALFALLRLKFGLVLSEPFFQLRYMSEHDILDFFRYLRGVAFKLQ